MRPLYFGEDQSGVNTEWMSRWNQKGEIKAAADCTKKSQRGEIIEVCLKISSAFSFFAYVQSPTWAFLPSLLSQNMQAHRETFWTLRECSQGSQGKLAMKGSDVAWEPQKSPWAKCAPLPVSSLALLCQVATTPVSVSTHYSESHIDSNTEQRWFRLAFPFSHLTIKLRVLRLVSLFLVAALGNAVLSINMVYNYVHPMAQQYSGTCSGAHSLCNRVFVYLCSLGKTPKF